MLTALPPLPAHSVTASRSSAWKQLCTLHTAHCTLHAAHCTLLFSLGDQGKPSPIHRLQTNSTLQQARFALENFGELVRHLVTAIGRPVSAQTSLFSGRPNLREIRGGRRTGQHRTGNISQYFLHVSGFLSPAPRDVTRSH